MPVDQALATLAAALDRKRREDEARRFAGDIRRMARR